MIADTRRWVRWRELPAQRLALACGTLYLPFLWFGYGTDIDISNIRRSGRSILEGEYQVSRTPGAIVNELATGVLDSVGGAWLVNLGSATMAVLALVFLARIVARGTDEASARVAVLIVATNPWFWVAATSLGDFVYAIAFVLAGVDACQRDRRLLAGALFALAIGCRASSLLLVASYLIAEAMGPGVRRGAILRTGTVAAVFGAAMFVPAWLDFDRRFEFLQNQFEVISFGVLAGRWAVKNVAFLGVPVLVVLVLRGPVVLAAIRRFRSDVLVRFAIFMAVATELLFLRLPFKPLHLLPVVVALALLLAASPTRPRGTTASVLVAYAVFAVVSVQVAAPDRPHAASDARFAPAITWGVVANEIDCRVNPPFRSSWPDLDTDASEFMALEVFDCQSRSWRGE